MDIKPQLFVGLMSGTSIDGIDTVVVDLSGATCKLIANHCYSIPASLKNALAKLSTPQTQNSATSGRVDALGELDAKMGHCFADAINHLLFEQSISAKQIAAIGSHGQTIRHRPAQSFPFTKQIGDPNIIAHKTGITTIADFRRMDMAAGGQGAPLAPAFHDAVLRTKSANRLILNLGGIANITLLPQDLSLPVIGFDTGTANTLLDTWFITQFPEHPDNFDRSSNYAQQGEINKTLLAHMLKDAYFMQSYPKSTGREYFNLHWLKKYLKKLPSIPPQDVQRTLLELTVQTIAAAIQSISFEGYELLACGGGMHNDFLLNTLSKQLQQPIITTNNVGVDGDYMEAMTFAWLAKQRLKQLPGNLPSVTGASQPKILGAIYLP